MPNLEVISAGNAVTLAWRLWTKIPPPPVIYDPPTLPVITIIDPTGTIQISREPMTKLEPGLYGFTYITPAGGPLGVWSAMVNATDAFGTTSGSVDAVDQLKATPVFRLV